MWKTTHRRIALIAVLTASACIFGGRDALTAGTTLFLPVVQTCGTGEHRWPEIPKPGQAAHACAEPAPMVRLIADKSADHAAHGAKTFKAGDIVVEAPWTRATPAGAQAAGGFLKVTNTGKSSDRIVGGTFAPAGKVEVHEMAIAGGVMRMRELDQGLEIKPGETVELKPGSFHMMFIGLKEGLVEGRTVKGALQFQNAGRLDVEYSVAPLGAKDAGGHKHH